MDAKRFTEICDLIIDNPYQRLVGNISQGYRYLDTDIVSQEIAELKNQLNAIYGKRQFEEATRMYSNKAIRNKIKKVIFNDPATIVFWSDGKKTVVKCGERDIYDPEKGLAMAIAKRALGNEGNYYELFKKWLPEENYE